MIHRRAILGGGAAFAALAAAQAFGETSSNGETKPREAKKMTTTTQDVDFRKISDAEWRKRLNPQQYDVLRKHGTERAGTSPLNAEKRHGRFICAGCGHDLFASDTKFESGTGWPSFYQPLENAVGETKDRTFGMLRTEIHCRRCGGHLGHVFDDGPKPTGLRYCMNGLALTFHPGAPTAS